MRISLITSTILCALLMLVAAPLAKAAPASQATPDPANDWQRVQQAGKLVIGTSADYPPFEFYNSNYALDGFDVALAKALGEQLVFNADVNDPRPRLLLEQFFRRLYNQGALRGRVPEEGYRITQSQPQDGAIQFDIQIAPAFPIDRLFLTFVNLDGEWRAELNDG